jgi:hypothetical protein
VTEKPLPTPIDGERYSVPKSAIPWVPSEPTSLGVEMPRGMAGTRNAPIIRHGVLGLALMVRVSWAMPAWPSPLPARACRVLRRHGPG